MKLTIAVIFAMIHLVYGEPPVPNGDYTPPTQYGVPGQTVASYRPNNQYIPPSYQYGASRGGYDDQSEPANYNFEYHVQDPPSGNDFGHQESRQGDVATGKYYVLLPDGRRQVVEYTADADGYHPKITYEDVGGAGGYRGGNGGYQY